MMNLSTWYRPAACLGLMAAVLLGVSLAAAQEDEDDDLPEYLPGLLAEYVCGDVAVSRIDSAVQLKAHEAAPDERLVPGVPSASWVGRLFVLEPGEYRFHLHLRGSARLSIAGQPVLEGRQEQTGWLSSDALQLGYGYHPLRLEYESVDESAHIGLYWSGTRFGIEPIPERHLFHDPGSSPAMHFETGRTLAKALRCQACHLEAGRTPLPAPALTHLQGNISRDWLIDWLADESKDAQLPQRRMPHLGLARDEAAAMADYLLAQSKPSPPVPPIKSQAAPAAPGTKRPPKPRTEPSVDQGRQLALSLGCLACHQIGDLGQTTLLGGAALAHVAEKRPADFLHRWLHNPAGINADHRMPVFPLADIERADLVAYLGTLRRPESPANRYSRHAAKAADIERGRKLVAEHRCAACHRLNEPVPETASLPAAPVLSANVRWDHGCLAPTAGDGTANGPASASRRVRYDLSSTDRLALQTYYSLRSATTHADTAAAGRFVLEERNCLACHARGLSPGIAAHLEAVTAADEELLPLTAALAPPSLTGVGDKLTDQALADAITLKHKPLRPWLRVRMPKFALADEEMALLTQYLIETDRIPELPAAGSSAIAVSESVDETAQELAGRRLVTADGFGCTSCHKIGNSEVITTSLAAQGTDLSLVGQRIRRSWFDRWVRNPARIVPRMEMPAIQNPIRGVLHDSIDEQLAAVWHVLNLPGFNPPKPNPVRIVRSRNVPGVDQRAAVLKDALEIDDRALLRPLVVGLANRHNLLFDLESARLAAWWLGDTALQRTRGKSWYWEAGGTQLLPLEGHGTLWLVARNGAQPSRHAPQPWGQFLAEFDWLEHVDGGVQFGYRLQYRIVDDRPPQVLRATETYRWQGGQEPNDEASHHGFSREIEIDGVPEGFDVQLAVLPAALAAVDDDGRGAALNDRPGNPRVRCTEPADARLARGDDSIRLTVAADASGRAHCRLEFSCSLPVDRFPVELPELPNPPPLALDVLPGYEVTVLPLPGSTMPTGLTWTSDGTLVFCSLKGQVYRAVDTDGDGLEDRLVQVVDGLAAPYGINVMPLPGGGDAIDVLHKPELMRLYDTNGDGQADRSEAVASGWGYTLDYHDWAVGLPRDAQGRYIVALPCQQDERSQAAAHLRGQAMWLVPRQPTADDPRRFALDPFCAGLRFPMGVAINRRGAIFASDNQGNYNPFNELNHLEPGKRYGFINKLEARPGFNPPLTPPAIDIPHPWTRSVNGLCFLDTPVAVREKLGHDLFGPFEGHLIGCEYNNQRLVRMSLEQIAGTYQGAVYPFDRPPAVDQPTFEGPTVAGVAPNGDLYVGNLRDSAWGGGQNTGSLARLRPRGPLPAGIAEVRARPDGFELRFTAPVDPSLASDANRYTLNAYRRISTPAYGGDDVDRHTVRIRRLTLADDRLSARLKVDKLQAGFVYEFYLQPLAAPGEVFHPAEAHYTLRVVPLGNDSP